MPSWASGGGISALGERGDLDPRWIARNGEGGVHIDPFIKEMDPAVVGGVLRGDGFGILRQERLRHLRSAAECEGRPGS